MLFPLILAFVFVLAPAAETAHNPTHKLNKYGRTIFKRSAPLKPPQTIKVDKVVVIQESQYSVILDIHYTYQSEVPANEIKLFVLPDMPYWASNPAVVQTGKNVARVSIDLYEKKMKEEQVEQYETSKLTVSFDHYAPDKFNGAIYKEIIPFKKVWKGRH
ncbi:MAG: hypothetical protein OHK006_05780 [Thermodesulfovibrionales bacterium]